MPSLDSTSPGDRPDPMMAPAFEFTRAHLIAAAFAAAALVFVFHGTFGYLYANWQREEYSHGFLIPLVSAVLLWQRRRQFEQLRFEGSWWGVLLVLAGLGIYFLGTLAAITAIDAYAFVVVLAGCLLAVMGWKAFRLALAPLGLLLLMNPLPAFLYNGLSSQLQLISSQLGVAVIRLFGISVHLQGNVIDLGTYQLQVVEACSGLNYLFPLLTLGVILASFLKVRPWISVVVVLSTLPITILMNSFRIGVIGILVDRFGTEQAEGFLHFFEGWVIFMACMALLMLETWLLVRLTGDRRSFRELFSFELPEARPADVPVKPRQLGPSAAAVLVVLMLAVYPAIAIPQRVELTPPRTDFIEFPMRLGEWEGRRGAIESIYLDVLQLDDYLMADFRRSGEPGVNLYSAYYASQRTGVSAHSPRSCLPGDGWEILEMSPYLVPGTGSGDDALEVNRVVMQKGASRQLVYYWFDQRGRDLTNEYLVKWYIFWDSLTRQRTDGALVRIITALPEGEDLAVADERLAEFTRRALPQLGRHVPH